MSLVPLPRSMLPRLFWGFGVLLVLTCAGWFAQARWGGLHPSRLVILAEAGGWEGCTPIQRQGLVILARDAFEAGGGFPASDAAEYPAGLPADAARLYLRAQRTAETLRLEARFVPPGGSARSWSAAGADPGTVLGELLEPFHLNGTYRRLVLPGECRGLGELLESTGWSTDHDLDAQHRQAEAFAQRHPGCASAWLALAMIDHRRLILASGADPVAQTECRSHFDRALALFPNYPRASHQVSTFLTDLGNQREALDLLQRAVSAHPRVIRLRTAQGYAARTAGLLEGAARAIQARDRLQGASRPGTDLAENLYLYNGQWDRFEETLRRGPESGADALTDFYRGYIRFLRQDPAHALPAFRAAQAHPGKKVVFERLAGVFQAALEEDRPRALSLLNQLRDERLRLRVPDGEFTFKLAEAYALLGEDAQAIQVAERAFAQGFGCLRWYETAPLLARVRAHPRWPSLHQHLVDRHALLESHFPAQRFAR